jgi:hypothetical protein
MSVGGTILSNGFQQSASWAETEESVVYGISPEFVQRIDAFLCLGHFTVG